MLPIRKRVECCAGTVTDHRELPTRSLVTRTLFSKLDSTPVQPVATQPTAPDLGHTAQASVPCGKKHMRRSASGSGACVSPVQDMKGLANTSSIEVRPHALGIAFNYTDAQIYKEPLDVARLESSANAMAEFVKTSEYAAFQEDETCAGEENKLQRPAG
jgi:hypothetical protein